MELMAQRRPVLIAAFLISVLLALVLAGVPYFGMLFIAIAVMSLLAIGGTLFRKPAQRHSDPYDLRLLREIHEQAEIEEALELHVHDDADVICPHCGHLYGHKFKICPDCRRMP